MEKSCSPARAFGQIATRLFVVGCLVLLTAGKIGAQSTYGTILGTVHDSSGALLAGAQVTLVNTGTAATRTTVSSPSGDFTFNNIDVGHYALAVTSAGFEKTSLPEVLLTARETLRLDATLRPGSEAQTVLVQESSLPVINTEVSNLAETKVGDDLVDLPSAIYSRSTGSTSPISTLTTEAGVQTDDSGNLSVMGATAALLSVTIDGISSLGVEYSGPVNEMFPSFNSIEEIRVSESNNNAEFGGVADITTISKAGANQPHGSLFENHENSVFNAGDPFSISKPKIVMNDFGGTLGGPLKIPHLYNGHDKTFFFISYEGLRLPRETPLLLSVPSAAMRVGNLTSYLSAQGLTSVYSPDGTELTSADPSNPLYNVPVAIDPIAANALKYLYPEPNYGAVGEYANNFQMNFPAPISANQGDVRLDHILSAKQNLFARFSYKNRQIVTAPSEDCIYTYCAEAGSPLLGGFNTPEVDEGMTFAHNYVFSPSLLNEFRAGYNAQHTSQNQNFKTAEILNKTGFSVLQADTLWPESPEVLINGFMSTGAGNPGMQRSQIIQALDNLTWNHGAHAFKFGADFKRLSDHDENLFGNYRSGWFVFNGDSTVGNTIGDPYTAFLTGYPDWTEVSSTNRPTMDGLGYSYAGYAQDNWKITPRLTLNLGLRYEINLPIHDTGYNNATFLPTYQSTGAVVVPNPTALSYTSSDFLAAIAPTPILTAAQAGIPQNLRSTDKTGWGPRLGFAWRPLASDKTVLRGGWGRFMVAPMGFALYAGAAVHSSYLGTYDQDYASDLVTPLLSLSDPFQNAEAANFNYAFPVHYKNPSVQQWNLTIEQDLGLGIGARLSYTGSHGKNLDAMVDLNQVQGSATAFNHASAPFPSWAVIQSVANAAYSNYNSATLELSRHRGQGVTFDASYTFTRDLSNAGGATPNAFAVAGGSFLTDRFNPRRDYGNVVYDRRHRLLATYLYDLPFGRNKRWLSTGKAMNLLAGGWQIAGITVLQSGPFLTPFQTSVDPANTNILTTIGQSRTDQSRTVSPYAAHRTTSQWLNPAAFPYDNLQDTSGTGLGRFGNAPVGGVVGPGSANFSFSLTKTLVLTEKAKFEFAVQTANAFNHRNYAPPNMQADSSGFGSITALQSAEGAGPRALNLSARIAF